MTDWSDIDLTGDPRLLLGRRKSTKRLELHRVEVDEGLFDDLRSIATTALQDIHARDPKPYSEFAHATTDDYFEVEVQDLPTRRDRRKRENDPDAWAPASALDMTHEADDFPRLDAEQLRNLGKISFYVIAFENDDSYVCFVRKQSPQRPLKPGLRFLRFGDTVRKIDAPDLAIDEGIDLVLTPERCAILAPAAFRTLFADVRVAFESVTSNTTAIREALDDVIPLSADALSALQGRCGRRISDAHRLHRLIEEKRSEIAALSPEALEELLKRRSLDVLKEGELVLDDAEAGSFLDLLDGRFFDDDITGAARRADAYSPR